MRSLPLHRVTLVAVALCAGLASCVSGGASTGGTRGPADRITAEELDQWASQDLFTLVQRLRPRWMQVRAPVTAQGRPTIAIILDGVRQQGSLELLRNFKASDVAELRFINSRDATTRFGTDMMAGAIAITTKS